MTGRPIDIQTHTVCVPRLPSTLQVSGEWTGQAINASPKSPEATTTAAEGEEGDKKKKKKKKGAEAEGEGDATRCARADVALGNTGTVLAA